MPARQRGFTLIEQLAVLALVGSATASALPALVAINNQAEATALASLAGAAGSAMLLNQAGCLLTDQHAVPGKCQPVHNCQQVAGLLMAPLPAAYQIQAQALSDSGGQCQVVRLRDGAAAGFHGAATGG